MQTDTIIQAKASAETIRTAIRTGQIPYDIGMAELKRALAVLDDEGRKIAKKYGRRYHNIDPKAYIR